MSSAGISLDQAPALPQVMSFFLLAPVAMIAAGVLVIDSPQALFLTPSLPSTVALTHLGTLGVLAAVMLGATYQLCPVLGGVRVPWPGLARLVHAGLVVGLTGLVWGLITGSAAALKMSAHILPLVFLAFLVPAGIAVRRARPIHTIIGMRVSLACVAIAVVFGAMLELGYLGVPVPGTRQLWIQVHLSLGVLGWVGGLLMAVSWQLVPMFYLTPPIESRLRIRSLWALGLSITSTVVLLPLDRAGLLTEADPGIIAAITMLPGVLVVWVIHPMSILHALRNRRRKRVDPSKDYWVVAMWTAPVVLLTAILTLWSTDPRWGLTFGWLAVWGWAGIAVHGMLTRIVPFLVWFHRFSHQIGKQEVPSVRKLYPANYARRELWIHGASVAVGACAIWIQAPYLVTLVGVLLLLTGASMLYSMVRILRWRVS
jgi:hypothetical protein